MRRTSIMTLGFVLIFVGIQLNLVETYVLTPRFSNFLMENASQLDSQPLVTSAAQNSNNPAYNSPYYQAAFPTRSREFNPPHSSAMGLGVPKTVSTPGWLCWPILFLGTVVFLHGLSSQRE